MKSEKKITEHLKSGGKQYDVPYRYNSTITIDLFENSEIKNKVERTKSKSRRKSASNDKYCINALSNKKSPFKNLMKSCIEYENDERVVRTLKKI